jgi:hypothetical protein
MKATCSTKKLLIFSLSGIYFLLGANHDSDISGHTFFATRPHFQSGSPEKESFFKTHQLLKRVPHSSTAIEIVGYYSTSTDKHGLARYFMPYGKTTLNVREYKNEDDVDEAAQTTKDVEARHFNIQTNSTSPAFESTISFAPEQKICGIGFDIKQTLATWHNCMPKFWFEISFPIEQVSNKMNLTETITQPGTGIARDAAGNILHGLDNSERVANMTQAFKQQNWLYGKIDAGHKHHTWGIADIECKFYWMGYCQQRCNFTSYLGFIIPTGTKINQHHAAYVFSPIVGNNHHWGIMMGNYLDTKLYESNCSSLFLLLNLNNMILFGNKQMRSFDLIGKPWSRYMETYQTYEDAESATAYSGTSGINIFTKWVNVQPRFQISHALAFQYQYKKFLAEIGYNIYARHQERVNLYKHLWEDRSALKAVQGSGQTTLARTIGKNFPSSIITQENYTDSIISINDLDMLSASHPSAISNTLYAGVGYDTCVHEHTVSWALGVSREFSHYNNVLNRWTTWAKCIFTL